MNRLDYALVRVDYTWENALCWGNFRRHCKKATEEKGWNRFVHILIAAIECLPILSQIASLFEKIIVSRWRDLQKRPIPLNLAKPDLLAISEIRKALSNIPTIEELNAQLQSRAAGEDVDSLFNPPVIEVIKGLYLGSQRQVGIIPPHERGREEARIAIKGEFEKNQINHVMTCSGEAIPAEHRFDSIVYTHFGFGDKPNNSAFLSQLPGIIREIHRVRLAKQNVFIHCNAGASRSPSCVIAYLMVLGLTFMEAYRFLKSQRLIVNVGNFEKMLQELNVESYRKLIEV